MTLTRKRLGLFAAVLLFLSTLVGIQAVEAAELPGARIYVSSSSPGNVDGISFTSGDILVYDSNDDTWAMFFDGSDVLPASANIDSLFIAADNPANVSILFGFTGVVNVPGVGSVDDSDLVIFSGTPGSTTAGTFESIFDGSNYGLTSGGEDIDALGLYDNNLLTFSLLGTGSVPRADGSTLSVPDEDLIALGGAYLPVLDSSDVGFTGDLVSTWIDPNTEEIFGSALNGFNIGGLRGDGDDIFVFTGTTGDPSSGTFDLFWDGDANRFGGEQIDALHITTGTPTPPGEADLSITVGTDVVDAVVAGDTVTYSVDVTNNGPDTANNVVVTDALPSGLTFVSTTGCALDPNGLPCSLGDLASGASASFTVAVTVDSGTLGNVDNTVEVTSSTADPDQDDNSATASILVAGPPAAVDDGPASNSAPGDDFHTETDTQFDLAAPGLLANDSLGSPAGAVSSFGGGDLGGSVTDHSADSETPITDGGELRVNADGSVQFVPPADFAGPFTFQYRLQNEGGFSDATVTVYVGPRPVVMGGDLIYLSTAGNGTVDDVTFEDEDILVYDRGSDTWAMFIDGSDLGLGTADIDGFAIRDDGSILMSLTAPRSIPGAGPADDSDIVLFTPTSTGETTAGTFEFFVDGSDLRLTAGGEDIDAVTEYGEGDIAISTFGSFNMGGGISGVDEDLIALGLTGTGPATSGNPSILFDGSDVEFEAEDIFGASIDGDTGIFYLANFGNFNIPGLTGDGDDIIAYAGTPGPDTSGTFSTFFAGEDARFDNNQIDGLHVVPSGEPNTPPRILNEQTEFDAPEYDPLIGVELGVEDDQDARSALTVSVAGPDADAVSLLGDELLFLPVFDFENPIDENGDGVYEVEVTVTDTGGLTATKTFAFTVTDVEPDPIEFLAGIDENEAATLEDAEVLEVGELFPLVFYFLEQFDNETPVFWIDATVNGESVADDASSDCPELPVQLENAAFCFLELAAADAPDGVEIEVAVTLQFYVEPGDDPELEALLQATFTDSVWYRTDDAPVIDLETVTASVPEKQTAATDVNATDTTDSEGSGLTYSVENVLDAALFTLDTDTGVFAFIDPPDFENPQDVNTDNVYEVFVVVRDSNGLRDSATVRITVTDVDETASISGRVFNDLNEDGINQDEPTVPGVTVDLFFDDSYVESRTPGPNGEYSFTGLEAANGYEVSFEVSGNYEFSPQDQGDDDAVDSDVNSFGSISLDLAPNQNLVNVDAGMFIPNEAPVITTPGPFSVIENQVGSINIESTDDVGVEGDGLTYSLSGTDSALFTINATTGVISFEDAPDFENPGDDGGDNSYAVRVTVTDADSAFSAADIIIDVTNVIEQATVGNFIWLDVNENGIQEGGEPGLVGIRVQLYDDEVLLEDTTDLNGFYSFTVDPGDYELSVNPSDAGANAGMTGVNQGNDPTVDSDFDQTFPIVNVTLADDEVNNDIDGGIVLYNQAPIVDDQSFSVAEDASGGDPIGMVVASDPDTDALTYSLNDESNIAINPTSGALTVATGAALEGGSTIVVTVTVADPDGRTDTATISVAVTAVNNPPVIADQSFTVLDESPGGTLIGTIVSSDPDDDLVTFQQTSSDDQIVVNEFTGEVTVVDISGLATGTEITLTVVGNDGAGGTTEFQVTVTITALPLALDTPTRPERRGL